MLRFVTDFGDTAVTVPLAVLMAGFLAARGEWRLALGWVLAVLACAGAIALLKLLSTACGDPLGDIGLASPSGHTAISIAVYGGFAAVLARGLAPLARTAVVAGASLLSIGIAVSRTLLHYHSPIEVVVGMVVGIAALAAILQLVGRRPTVALPSGWLAAGAVVVALLFHGERWPAEQAIRHVAGWFEFLRPWCS